LDTKFEIDVWYEKKKKKQEQNYTLFIYLFFVRIGFIW